MILFQAVGTISDGIIDVFLFHPQVGKAIDQGSEKPVPQMVFGFSGHTRKMLYRYLDYFALLKEDHSG
jgi:hypothetical protein